jgi:hypothetical protein
MLEHSATGPQISLGKWKYVHVFLHDDVMCKYGPHRDEISHTTKFEVLRVASLKVQVFLDVTHQLINNYTHSEGWLRLRFQGHAVDAEWRASP